MKTLTAYDILNIDGTLYRSVRPVITLNHKVIATGKGTADNPYILSLM